MVKPIELDTVSDSFKTFILTDIGDQDKFERLLLRFISRLIRNQQDMEFQNGERKLNVWQDRVKDLAKSYRSFVTYAAPVVQGVVAGVSLYNGVEKMMPVQKCYEAGSQFFQALETGDRSKINFFVEISKINSEACEREKQRLQQQSQENQRTLQQALQAQANIEREVAKQQ